MTALSGSIQLFGKTAALWASDNTVLLANQPGKETDTGQLKIGDGVTAWNSLPYVGNFNSALLTGGVITVGTYSGTGTNNDIRVTASTFFIRGSGSYSAIQTDFADIALSSAGTQRYIGLYGTTSNTISKVEGSEAALAAYPATPANTVLIGYVLVSDAAISSTVDLSGYVLKSEVTAIPVDGSSLPCSSNGVFDALALKQDSSSAIGYCLAAGWAAFGVLTPADATTYYFGYVGNNSTTSSPQGRDIPVPVSGSIRTVGIMIYVTGTPATSEDSTFSVEIYSSNGTFVSSNIISTTIKWNVATRDNRYTITGLNIPITQGQFIAIKMVTPTWVTNPTNTFGSVLMYVK